MSSEAGIILETVRSGLGWQIVAGGAGRPRPPLGMLPATAAVANTPDAGNDNGYRAVSPR
ncbi:MAG: hypothetical protein LBG06_07270 [Deltaproteobacteria bacterium]|nr:hypothetical protein [Deltaproteobacteria bacterium]